MHAIRIVLGTMPPMLGDIVRDILAGQQDMEIVGEMQTDDELLDVLATEAADVVVMQLDVEAHGHAGTLLTDRSTTVSVLALSTDGRTAAVYELRPRKTSVVELSPKGLRDSIRRAFAARA